MTTLTSIVNPAFKEAPSIGALVTEPRNAASWRESVIVDDGDNTATQGRPRARASFVTRTNKGHGAAIKTGVRQATGRFILIIDADGQHRPSCILCRTSMRTIWSWAHDLRRGRPACVAVLATAC